MLVRWQNMMEGYFGDRGKLYCYSQWFGVAQLRDDEGC